MKSWTICLKRTSWWCKTITNRDSALYYICKDVNIERLWFYTTYNRVCQRNFLYLISILAKFVLFEYNHVVIVIESQYRESDFYDLGWERLSLTILMSQYDIIMYVISMQSEIYSLNLYLSCQSISYTKKLKATFRSWGNFWATFGVLEQLWSNFGATLEQLWSNFGATFWENWSNLWTALNQGYL